MQLLIDTEGQVFCLYTEQIELSALGTLTVRRGSHVEPDGQGQWWADLSPAQGPTLGPFAKRSEALAAELYALEGHRAVGGLRASIYNPMSLAGVEALASFMREFERVNG